mmetsp:Transcript_9927/g.16986  ORF Transcript_9927/g.16986 Transcript_9927/m.16986 type:complete len:212 (+) Transcript_9927:2621-3256(+)
MGAFPKGASIPLSSFLLFCLVLAVCLEFELQETSFCCSCCCCCFLQSTSCSPYSANKSDSGARRDLNGVLPSSAAVFSGLFVFQCTSCSPYSASKSDIGRVHLLLKSLFVMSSCCGALLTGLSSLLSLFVEFGGLSSSKPNASIDESRVMAAVQAIAAVTSSSLSFISLDIMVLTCSVTDDSSLSPLLDCAAGPVICCADDEEEDCGFLRL